MSLVGLTPLLDFLQLVLWTGQVEGERPVSAIIVGPIGSGKTSILEKLECDFSHFTSDLTAREVSMILKEKPQITHMLLGDMLAMFGHKAATVTHTVSLVARLTGDTIKHDPMSGETVRGRRIGLITAIPPEDIATKRIRQHIYAGGFASRFVIVKFNYTPKTIAAIHAYIASDAYTSQSPSGTNLGALPSEKKRVKIPDGLARKIQELALHLKTDPIGARMHHHLRSLVKASARSRKLTVVEQRDFERVEKLTDFVTEEGRKL